MGPTFKVSSYFRGISSRAVEQMHRFNLRWTSYMLSICKVPAIDSYTIYSRLLVLQLFVSFLHKVIIQLVAIYKLVS